MQSEIVTLANDTLTGEWRHGASRKQLIIVCHGYQGSSEDPTIIAITDGLNKRERDTFTFNFSQNTGGFDIEHQVSDIKLLISYFKDYDELVLLAGSFAALPAAIAANKLANLNGLITLNGFFGQDDLGKEHRRAYIKFRIAALLFPKYREILSYFKRELQPAAIRVPALAIHSRADESVFIKQSQDFYQQLTSPKQFIELKDANHGITAQADRQRVVAEIDGWLKITFPLL
jgi:pimeloyl-ACP methyl ester carboxylesterase